MKTLIASVAAASAAIVLATSAAAGPGAAKQRIVISGQGSTFNLDPRTAGAIARDAGVAEFCCWTARTVIRDGQVVEVTSGPEMTLTGKNGTLTARNRMEWADVARGYELFTGTWKVVRGTGAYEGVRGGGRVAGVRVPGGDVKWRREGFLWAG